MNDICTLCSVRKVITGLLYAFTLQSYAADIASCSADDEVFVKTLNSARRLSNEALVSETVADGLTKELRQCVINSKVMMDGLSFTLYKGSESERAFIRVHNDFDGSSKLYGPFN